MRELEVGRLPALVADTATGGTALRLLDIREPWEVELAPLRLDGAHVQHLPLSRLASDPDALQQLDPAQPVVCLCHHGVRSAHVAAFLQRQGFAAVYNLTGGIDAWSQQVDPSVARY